MKNLLLFFAISALICTSCSRHDAYLNINDINFGWDSEYDPTTQIIRFNEPWSGRGWMWGTDDDTIEFIDCKSEDKVVIELTDIKGPVSKISLVVMYAKKGVESRELSTIVDGRTTIRVKLDEKSKGMVKRVFLMADAPCQMRIRRAYFDKLHHYSDHKVLRANNLGIISSDQFDGYTDKAMVEFTYETYGSVMGVNDYGETVDMRGWGLGVICSAADILGMELPTHTIAFQELGLQSYVCELGDLRYFLSLEDEDGESGLYWTVWPIGGLSRARVVGVTIAEAID